MTAEMVAILLAAGKSSRMHTRLPQVLHAVAGRPMLGYVLDACRQAGIASIYVVGFSDAQVRQHYAAAPLSSG